MPDVFLSYKRENLTAASRLVDALRAAGLDVWWDADIPPDAPWEATIEQALVDAPVVLVCWSKAAVASDNVRSEARWAREQGRLIQAFVEPCSPPLFFGERQGVDLSTWAGDPGDVRFKRLVSAIHARLDKVRPDPPPALPPSEAAAAVEASRASKAPSRRLAWIAAAVVVLLALVGGGLWFTWRGFAPSASAQRVAVLPFQPIGQTPELRDTAANLSDKLQSVLSSSQIETVSTTDVESLRGPGQDQRIKELGVGLLFDGTVRRDGDNVAVRVHLDDPVRHASLWSAEISQPAAKADPLQAQVAARTVAVLTCAAKMLRPSGGLSDPDARALYLHACDLLETQGWGDDIQAVFALQDSLKQLIARAPDFAPGHAMLANAISGYLVVTPDNQIAHMRAQATAEAKRALALDPKDVMARLALYGLFAPHDVPGRERMLDAALDADPLSPVANGAMGWFLTDAGRLQDALPFEQKAAAANPLSLDWTPDMILAWMGRADEAIAEISRLSAFWPNASQLWYDQLLIARQQGRWDEALALINDPVRRPKNFDATAVDYQRALIDALRTRDPKKQQAVRQATLATADTLPAFYLPDTMTALAQLGFVDDALRLGAHYAAVETQAGDNDVGDGILFSPAAIDLRRDPRFIGLAAKLGLVDYWRSTGKWPDFCSDPGLPYDCKAEAAKLARQPAAVR